MKGGKGKQVAAKAPAAPSSSGKRKVAAASEDPTSSRKRRRRPGVLQFFDDAAVDADPDYESEEDREMEEEIGDQDFIDNEQLENRDIIGAGKVHLLPFIVKEELSGDDLEELIKDRYGNGSEVYNDDPAERDDKVPEEDEMKDVIIWRVKCMAGHERQMAFCFMQKYIELDDLGTKLPIFSAFALEHVKGYVFVEADKLSDVTEACKGFCNVYSSRINCVPRSEIPHLLASRNKLSEVSKGKWVRMKNGKYKGDLAQVVSVDNRRKQVTIKLVPRIDLQAIAKKFGGGVSLKLAAVPAPRLISSRELETFRPHIEVRCDSETGELFDVLDGMKLKDGYLYKKVSIGSVIFWGVQPSSNELLLFSDTNNNMDENLNWVSSIYNTRKKKPLVEASDNNNAPAVTKSGYSLHDLVLFGRKHFGVIVSVEKDCFKILKGDIEGAEVMTIKIQDIKKLCEDKMFTALDQKRKTIFINDIVKVLVGSLQGKEGVVRHLFKGTLFIQVENETENSGFVCAKSESCEKIKHSKDSFGATMGKGKESTPSFPQSPIRTFDQEDNADGSSRRRRSYNDQMFSIGQTLRIREGPLKGYLCRVVGIYRSDVTVKLDSLVKIITVKDKSLAVPKLKADNSSAITDHTARSPDHFGTRELSIACPQFGETSTQAEKSSWDSVIPSFGRDRDIDAFPKCSWISQASGEVARIESICSALRGHAKRNRETDLQIHIHRRSLEDTRSIIQELDTWEPFSMSNSAVCSNENKKEGCEDDPWGSKLVSVARADAVDSEKAMDDWGKKPGSCTDQGHEADPWGNMVTSAAKPATGGSNETIDGWGKTSGSFTGQVLGADPWSSKVTGADRTDTCGADGTIGGWGKPSNSVPLVKDFKSASEQAGNSEKSSEGWSNKTSVGKNTSLDEWEKSKPCVSDAGRSWDKESVKNKDACAWDSTGKGKVDSEEDAWGKVSKSQEKNNDSWNTAAACQTQSNKNTCSWDNKGDGTNTQEDPWGKAAKLQEKSNDNWDAAAVCWSNSTANHGCELGSWDREKGNEGADENDQINWDKPGNFQGARGVTVDDSVNKSQGGWNKNSDWGQTSNWKRGREQDDEVGGHRNHENWSRQREFDGARGSSWERGKGQQGWRGGMGHDTGDQDWSSGRGGGRGRGRGRGRGYYGEAGNRRDGFDETRPGQAGNWNNQQNSEDPSSNLTNDKNAGWNKAKSFGGNEGSSGNINQIGSWSKTKSLDGHSSAGWNSFSQDADGRADAKGVDLASTWEKAASNWEKPHTGQQSQWSKDDTNKWSTTKSSGWEEESFKDVPGAQENLNISSNKSFIRNSQNTSNVNEGSKPSWDKWSSRNDGKAAGGSGWDSAQASNAKQLSGWIDCTSTGAEAGDRTSKGVWDRPRADEPYKYSETGAGMSGWKGASRSDEKAKDTSMDKSSTWNRPEVDKVDAWDTKGKRNTADGDWDANTKSQEKKIDEATSWDDNSSQSKELPALQGRSQTGSLDAAILRSTQTSMRGSSPVSSWEKGKNPCAGHSDVWKNSQTNDIAGGGWNQGGSFKQSENDMWESPKSFGEEATRGDQLDGWNKTREGGHGFGRGRGRGRNSWDSGNNYKDSSWSKQMDHDDDQRSNWGRGRGGNGEDGGDQPSKWSRQRGFDGGSGSSWGRGRGGNSEDGGDQQIKWCRQRDFDGGSGSSWGRGRGGTGEDGGDEQSKWSRQRDFDGGRGSNWGRGSGRFGGRDRSQCDNSDGPPSQERSWAGRGRGRGRNGGNNFDGGRSFSRGGGWDPGRGRFSSSDRKNDQGNFADGTPRNSVLSRGNDEKTGWVKSEGQTSAEFGGKTDQQVDWSKEKSLGGESSGWGNWSSNFSKDKADIASNSNKEQNNWGGTKEHGGGKSSGWGNWSSNLSKDLAHNASNSNKEQNNWGRTKELGGCQSSAWENWSKEIENVSKSAGTCSNSKDAQDGGDQENGWDKGAGAWGKNNEGSGSKGGW